MINIATPASWQAADERKLIYISVFLHSGKKLRQVENVTSEQELRSKSVERRSRLRASRGIEFVLGAALSRGEKSTGIAVGDSLFRMLRRTTKDPVR